MCGGTMKKLENKNSKNNIEENTLYIEKRFSVILFSFIIFLMLIKVMEIIFM